MKEDIPIEIYTHFEPIGKQIFVYIMEKFLIIAKSKKKSLYQGILFLFVAR